MRRIASTRQTAAAPRAGRAGAPSALSGLLGNGIAILLVALTSYAINLAGHYAETRGWSLRNALVLQCGLAGALALVAAVFWAGSRTLRLMASWLCLASLIHAAWIGWILLHLIFPNL